MKSIRLKYENSSKLVLLTLLDRVEEWRRFSNEEKDLIISKKLNEELYEMKNLMYDFVG